MRHQVILLFPADYSHYWLTDHRTSCLNFCGIKALALLPSVGSFFREVEGAS